MKEYFYHVLRDVCNDLREELKEHPEKEEKIKGRLIRAYDFLNNFFGMREYQNIKLAISQAEKMAGELKNYFDKALYFYFSSDEHDKKYMLLASYIVKNKMAPENAIVFIFISNGVFLNFAAARDGYRMYQQDIFYVLPYELDDIKIVPDRYKGTMKQDEKRPLYDYSKPSFYQAPVKRDMTPDEKDVHIMERLKSFDREVAAVSSEEWKDASKMDMAKHRYLADRFFEIIIDSLTDEEIARSLANRNNQFILSLLGSLDDTRKDRVLNSFPEIMRKILLQKMKKSKKPDEDDYLAKKIFFRTAGQCVWGNFLDQGECFRAYGMVFIELDKRTPTEELIRMMNEANEKYARAATRMKSDMVRNGRYF